jgi:hypothetical protein
MSIVLTTDYERGKVDGRRFAEFSAYERVATLRDGRSTYVAEQVSRAYFDGLRDAGCRIR